jgi:small subunit ribosomal protein S16
MLTIRLQRTGKRNQADFRIVLAEKAAPVNKKIVEVLGSYNPRKKLFRVKSEERLQYWLGQKVAVSPTVHNLFVTNKVLDGGKVKAFSIPKKSEESEKSEKSEVGKPKEEAAVEAKPEEQKSEKPELEKSEKSDKLEGSEKSE